MSQPIRLSRFSRSAGRCGTFTIRYDVPSSSRRRMVEDDGPSASSPGVRYPSSAKNTRPSSCRRSATSDQKDSKRSSGTCESQKPMKTTSQLGGQAPSRTDRPERSAPARRPPGPPRWRALGDLTASAPLFRSAVRYTISLRNLLQRRSSGRTAVPSKRVAVTGSGPAAAEPVQERATCQLHSFRP